MTYSHLGNIRTIFLIYIESHDCSCVHNLNHEQLREVNGHLMYNAVIFYLNALDLVFLFRVYTI
jgi:hypothetical protein